MCVLFVSVFFNTQIEEKGLKTLFCENENDKLDVEILMPAVCLPNVLIGSALPQAWGLRTWGQLYS